MIIGASLGLTQAPFDERGAANRTPHDVTDDASATLSPNTAIGIEHGNTGRIDAVARPLDGSQAGTWNELGATLVRAGQIADATTAFQQALALDPTHRDAQRNMARCLALTDARQTHVPSSPERERPQGDRTQPRFGLDWQIGASSGWGVYGLNLALNAIRRREFTPVVFDASQLAPTTPGLCAEMQLLHGTEQFARQILREGGKCPFPTFHAIGNSLCGGPLAEGLQSTRRVGLVFFENTQFDDAAKARGLTYDRIVAGSTWNEELLRAQGFEQTRLVFQGIDTATFHPAPRTQKYAGRFVVFSGGKLEYRKGQDLVIAAFSRFYKTHADARLMVAWHNHWPQTMGEIATAGFVRDLPAMKSDHRLDLIPWLSRYGVPESAIIDLGLVPHNEMATFLRDAHVALFPNRAEGGTNLVAMEALACGVPCILSANTGHLDLTSDDHNIVLHHQRACNSTASYAATDGWGESDVDEIVEALEFAYTQRAECLRRSMNAARVMQRAAWHYQIDRLFDAVGDVLT